MLDLIKTTALQFNASKFLESINKLYFCFKIKKITSTVDNENNPLFLVILWNKSDIYYKISLKGKQS